MENSIPFTVVGQQGQYQSCRSEVTVITNTQDSSIQQWKR